MVKLLFFQLRVTNSNLGNIKLHVELLILLDPADIENSTLLLPYTT